jgi:hypothetical protein
MHVTTHLIELEDIAVINWIYIAEITAESVFSKEIQIKSELLSSQQQ